MAVVKTRDPRFTGYRAGVMIRNGVGRTDDKHLIEWFKKRGYIVETDENEPKPKKPDEMSSAELKALLKENGVSVGNTKDKDKLLEKLKEVM